MARLTIITLMTHSVHLAGTWPAAVWLADHS
jgi:hypothetical protein